MKKILNLFICVLTLIVLSSCGHNVVSSSKGIGINLSWQGTSYIPDIKIGYWDVSNAVIRGNSSYQNNVSTGGNLFGSGGSTQVVQFSSGSQLNQANLKDSLISKQTDATTKQILALSVAKQKVNSTKPSATKTVSTAAGVGQNPPDVKPVLTGTDKIIQTVGQVAQTAVPVVGDVAKQGVKTVPSIIDQVQEAYSSTIKYVFMIIFSLIILISIVIYIYFRFFKSTKNSKIVKKIEQKIN